MRTSITSTAAVHIGGVTSVLFALRTPNSRGNHAVASRFIIKNYGDSHSPLSRQFVNTS